MRAAIISKQAKRVVDRLMSVMTALRNEDAEAVSLSAMNGRGDLLGVSLPRALLAKVDSESLTVEDTIRVLPDPDGSADLRLFLTDAAADRYGAWRDLGRRGSVRSVQAMNGNGDTLGVSLPRDVASGGVRNYDAALHAVAPGVVDVHTPPMPPGDAE